MILFGLVDAGSRVVRLRRGHLVLHGFSISDGAAIEWCRGERTCGFRGAERDMVLAVQVDDDESVSGEANPGTDAEVGRLGMEHGRGGPDYKQAKRSCQRARQTQSALQNSMSAPQRFILPRAVCPEPAIAAHQGRRGRMAPGNEIPHTSGGDERDTRQPPPKGGHGGAHSLLLPPLPRARWKHHSTGRAGQPPAQNRAGMRRVESPAAPGVAT